MNRITTISKSLIAYLLVFTLVLVTSQTIFGKNYYFSTSSGDDNRTSTQAQSSSTPWKSISKLNTFFSSLTAGDSVLFKRGETFYGAIIVKKSGTSSLPIVFSSYGTGNNPIISGFTTLSSWTSIGNGVYQSAASACKPTLNMVTVNGVQKAIGRFPNTGYLTYESHSGSTSITDNQLTGTPNWTGAEVVIRRNFWTLSRNKITNHSSNTLTYTGGLDEPWNNYGYFIQGNTKTLDLLGEWYFEPTGKNIQMYFGTNNPSSLIIKASTLDTLVQSNRYSYLTFTNLNFEGANASAFHIDGGQNISVLKCNINYTGGIGIYTSHTNFRLEHCIINNSNDVALCLFGPNSTIRYNSIKNTGLIPGMGKSHTAIQTISYSSGTTIEYNKIDSSGYNGIKVGGNNMNIKNNLINFFCLTTSDGAGIYMAGTNYVGIKINGNIILNGKGIADGTDNVNRLMSEGIYLDEPTSNIEISNNTVANCARAGIFLHNAHDIIIRENLFYNNQYQIRLTRNNRFPNDPIRNNSILYNTFFSKSSTQYSWSSESVDNDIPLLGTSNNNYFCKPIEDNLAIKTADPINGTLNRSLDGWKSLAKQDLNSKKSPQSITNENDILFEYNASLNNKVIPLNAVYLGVDGTVYSNSITLLPYKSVVLIKSSNQTLNSNHPPVINNQSFSVSENSPNGTIVGNVIASDPDAGQILSYSILSGNTSGAFAINSSTGVITVANSSALNTSFSLLFKVQDNGAGILSNQATITINLVNIGTCSATGNITYQMWNNITGYAVSSLTANINYPNNPSSSSLLTSMEAPSNSADNFGARIVGYICAPSSGNYTFWIAADDYCELWLSTDDQPANKQMIAYHNGYTKSKEWNKFATQKSIVISLVQGQRYYIEALMKDMSGPDNLAVGWLKPGETGTEPSEVVPGPVLSPLIEPSNQSPIINNQNFTLNENSINGSVVGTVIATDTDAEQTLTYSILSGNTSGAFAINASTGTLSVVSFAALNFEVTPSFVLIVKVQDNGTGTLSSQATISVSLADINEVPVITNQSFSVAENATNGTTVGTVIATDPDAAQTMKYSIILGNTSGALAINASTGALSVASSAALNFEVTPTFALVIKVQDNGTGSLSSQATVTVSLLNINEAPVISNQSFTIAENSANGTAVGTVVATDPDYAQTKTYSVLSGNTNSAFVINASTGVISVANSAALNFEATPSFSLIIKVQDNGSGNLSSQATITVSLNDINEAPVISNQSFSISENTSVGTPVGTVMEYDPDYGQINTFSIISGNTNGAFAINASTAVITVANSAALNFEVTPSFSLIIKVQDNGTGSLSSQATITVSLININEAPTISNQSFSVNENTANGFNVGTVVASDPDASQTLSYSITDGNTSNAFTINSLTGRLTVNNSVALNFSVNPKFSLNIRVTDNGTGILYKDATITVNVFQGSNQAPVVINQGFSINENSANGTTVGTVIATDPDAGQTKTFSILQGNTNGAFTILASTGVLTVANTTALDFESTPTFALIIKVQDNGTGSLSTQATITISLININEAPVISNQSFSISENTSVGTPVGTVMEYDPDYGQINTFSIISGNTKGAFAINASTAMITVANATALNFEVIPTFSLVIMVQDNGIGNLSSQATVTVSLININEAPVIINQSFTVAENAANETIVGTIIATDPDAGQVLSYQITSGNTENVFTINSITGKLIVNNSSALNINIIPGYTLEIKVSDNGAGYFSSTASITVSVTPGPNQQPLINDQIFTISQNSPTGTLVGIVEASDPDTEQLLSYSIVTGNMDSTFSINPTTGEIIVANPSKLQLKSSLTFDLVVKVQDNGSVILSNQAIVTILTNSVNAYPVILNQTKSTLEHQPIGTMVGNISAYDPDSGIPVVFAITEGNLGNAFKINASSGSLTINNPAVVCYEGCPVFNLKVKVQNNEGLSSEASITVNVSDINEKPVCKNQTFTISENTSTQTFVGSIIATEYDFNQILTYSLQSGNLNNAFAINTSTGSIKVNNASALNFEETSEYNLIVSVQDNGLGNLTALSTITIKIIDVNEPPVMENQFLSVVENPAPGTEIGYLQASDPDYGQAVTYRILGGNESQVFNLNSSTGLLSVADPSKLSYGRNPQLTLTVIAQDNGVDSLSAISVVTITLIQASSGELIYIDPTNGNDLLENGSILHPFNSWEDVTFENGATYLQKRGTIFSTPKSIRIQNKVNITIDAYDSGSNPMIFQERPDTNAIEFENTLNCSIRNLVIISNIDGSSCINVAGEMNSDLTIENTQLHGAVYAIKSISTTNNLKVLNTSISNNRRDGIIANNFGNIEIANCNINTVNQDWASDPNTKGSCINLSSLNGKVHIHNNELEHSGTGNSTGVSIKGTSIEGLIENNIFAGGNISGNQCLDLNNSTGIYVVRYNTIKGSETGINVDADTALIYYNQLIDNSIAIEVQQNKAVAAVNNTFVGNKTYSIESLSGSTIIAKNNIYYLTPATTNVYNLGGTFISDFNNFNIEKSGFLNGYSTLSSWTSANGMDNNSIVEDPLFESVESGNFRIQSNSPCINKGEETGIVNVNDYFGMSVPQAGLPDIGFCEVMADSLEPAKEIVLSTDDLISESDISVYPNPTTDIININLAKYAEQQVGIRIISMNGYEVYASTTKGEQKVTINMDNEKSGMYLAVLTINGHTITKNIIVRN